ncbi:InlB B-repeat-containing protein, partial [Arcanobacterium haemolyticum]|nr:InlB B-repeat-containing protein [Arcanobacterium haemolyticum]
MSSLTEIQNLNNLDMSNVTTAGSMFSGASSLTSLDLSGWDTSKITAMDGMFANTSSLSSLNVSGWDTSNATDLSRMFNGSGVTELDLSSWDTSHAPNMSAFFPSSTGIPSLKKVTFGPKWAFNGEMLPLVSPANLLKDPETGSWALENPYSPEAYSPSALTSTFAKKYAGETTTWVHGLKVTYTIVYDANGGTGAPSNFVYTTPSNRWPTYAQKVAIQSPTRAGFGFKSWNTKADGTGTSYQPGEEVNLTWDKPALTLYAQWGDPQPVKYVIPYDTTGGDPIAPTVYVDQNGGNYATIALTSEIPTREGYVFLGWTYGPNGIDVYPPGKVFRFSAARANEGYKFYAKWHKGPIRYTLNFDANGGENAPDSEVNDYEYRGIQWTLSQQPPTRSGYTFTSWNTEPDGSGTSYKTGDPFVLWHPTTTGTLYAQWTEGESSDRWTITYDANGGTGAPEDTVIIWPPNQTAAYGNLSEKVPTRPGYTFKNWNVEQDGSGLEFNPGDSYSVRPENIAPEGRSSLYAQWVLNGASTVTYNSNGGTGKAPAPVESREGAVIKLATGDGLTRAGYTFAGWNTKADGTGDTYQAGADFTVPEGNPTLYTQWRENDPSTVSFNPNGGSGTAPAAIASKEGLTVKLPAADGLTREGYTFAGWNTKADSTGDTYQAGADFVVPAGNPTLHAIWTANPATVSFDLNGANGSIESITSTTGGTVTLPQATGVSYPGFVFAGWTTVKNSDDVLAAGSSFTVPAGGATLYAKWNDAPASTVSFNPNGGSGTAPTAIASKEGLTIKLPAADGLTREGYTFAGWNTKADSTGDTYQAGADFVVPAGNPTLHAIWTANPATVSFDLNG